MCALLLAGMMVKIVFIDFRGSVCIKLLRVIYFKHSNNLSPSSDSEYFLCPKIGKPSSFRRNRASIVYFPTFLFSKCSFTYVLRKYVTVRVVLRMKMTLGFRQVASALEKVEKTFVFVS